MPNGGDPKKCAKASSFYKMIEPILRNFVVQRQLFYTEWYHNMPIFCIEWPDPHDHSERATLRRENVQIYIEPIDQDSATVSVFAHIYSDTHSKLENIRLNKRRQISFFVFRGQLPRDHDRLFLILGTARAILNAVFYDDLLSSEEWQEKQKILMPLFGN